MAPRKEKVGKGVRGMVKARAALSVEGAGGSKRKVMGKGGKGKMWW